jgi:hypothetical protein
MERTQPFAPALSAVFFAGLMLLIAGYRLSAALSLLGQALLIVMVFRGLAGLASL